MRNVWILCEQIVGFLRVCLRVPWYDVIFFQRAVFPFGLEKFIRILNRNIVYDLDDAIYLPVEQTQGLIGRIKRALKRHSVEGILSMSAVCICENGYIRSFAGDFCPRIHIITGPIDTERNFVSKRKDNRKERLTIGWVGSPATSAYLGCVKSALMKLAKRYDFQVVLVGIKGYYIEGVSLVCRAWDVASEVKDIHSFDIGICPMPDNDWTRGKVSVKILQYMANGVPSVVSFTPTNEEIILNGVDGFIARNDDEWVEKLSYLMENGNMRAQIGSAGRKRVEKEFSIQVNAPVFLRILKDVAQGTAWGKRKEEEDETE